MNALKMVPSFVLMMACGTSLAQQAHAVRYRLLDSAPDVSEITAYACLGPCACVIAPATSPIRGGFVAALASQTPIEDRFDIVHVNWMATIRNVPTNFRGAGSYVVGGEVALLQDMTLSLSENGAAAWTYESGRVVLGRPRPAIGVTVDSGLHGCRENVMHIVAATTCFADVDDGSGTGVPDGGVGIEDLLYYLSIYNAGLVDADVDDGSGTTTLDGGVGIEDLLHYLTLYARGC